jgi:hypothetical protein
MNQAPDQTDVHIVESDALPSGIGEPGVPPFALAFANAVFTAAGQGLAAPEASIRVKFFTTLTRRRREAPSSSAQDERFFVFA